MSPSPHSIFWLIHPSCQPPTPTEPSIFPRLHNTNRVPAPVCDATTTISSTQPSGHRTNYVIGGVWGPQMSDLFEKCLYNNCRVPSMSSCIFYWYKGTNKSTELRSLTPDILSRDDSSTSPMHANTLPGENQLGTHSFKPPPLIFNHVPINMLFNFLPQN